MDSIELELLKRKLLKDFGLNLDSYKDSFIERRLKTRMKALKVDTPGEYFRALTKNPGEYRELLDNLSINVSEFFRDSEVFESLQYLMAELALKHAEKGGSLLRFWSAGCASGEEAYTLAIILHLILGDDFSGFNLVIQASDIDERALEKARNGYYPIDRVKKLEPTLIQKYFKKTNNGYKLDSKIMGMVRFEKKDLFKDSHERYFDVILCRNVLIYVSKKQQEELIDRFHKALNPDGLLVLGKTETLPHFLNTEFKTVDARNRIYQKV